MGTGAGKFHCTKVETSSDESRGRLASAVRKVGRFFSSRQHLPDLLPRSPKNMVGLDMFGYTLYTSIYILYINIHQNNVTVITILGSWSLYIPHTELDPLPTSCLFSDVMCFPVFLLYVSLVMLVDV